MPDPRRAADWTALESEVFADFTPPPETADAVARVRGRLPARRRRSRWPLVAAAAVVLLTAGLWRLQSRSDVPAELRIVARAERERFPELTGVAHDLARLRSSVARIGTLEIWGSLARGGLIQ